jgi:hypothetical protein
MMMNRLAWNWFGLTGRNGRICRHVQLLQLRGGPDRRRHWMAAAAAELDRRAHFYFQKASSRLEKVTLFA